MNNCQIFCGSREDPIKHRFQVVTRRTEFELKKAQARAHILEGLLIALANLDAVIQTIRQSPDAEVARIQPEVFLSSPSRQSSHASC